MKPDLTSRRSSRRAFVTGTLGLAAVGAGVLLQACAAAPTPTTPPKPTTAPAAPTAAPATAAATAAPAATGAAVAPRAANQTLRYGMYSKLQRFDPSTEGSLGRYLIPNVFTPPFHFKHENGKNVLLPGTCLRYELTPEGKTYTLYVDPAAVWTDGTKFTAKDIKAWLEFISSPVNTSVERNDLRNVVGHAAVNKGETKEMEGLVAVDDLTLKITLSKADPLFPEIALIHYRAGGTKADLARNDPNGWWLKNPPSNGPFKIEKLDFEQQEFHFVQNPSWWRTKPILTKIVAIGLSDTQPLLVMYENNEVDVIMVIGDHAIFMEEKYPDSVHPMEGWAAQSGGFRWSLNVNVEPTDDINVRKALRHAVDVPTIVQAVYKGRRKELRGIINGGIPGTRYDTIHTTNEYFKFDPALAKKELAASKFGSAEALPQLRITPTATSGDKLQATEMMLEMWRKNLGLTKFDVRPSANDFGTDWDKKVNVNRSSGGSGWDAAQRFYQHPYSTSGLARTMGGYKNVELDAMIDKAYFMDRNDPEYIKFVQAVEDKFLADYPYIPLMIDAYSYYAKPWVKNLKANWHNVTYAVHDIYLAPR